MKRALFFLLAIALMASPALAGGIDDALSLVPPDAASVGVIRLDELRSSPLAAKIFDDTDRLAGDGDATRFLEETGLNPKRDVDVVVVAASPAGGGAGESGLVLFEGRFDPPRLQAAIALREQKRLESHLKEMDRVVEEEVLALRRTWNGGGALPCPDCSRPIAAGAVFCPHCGARVNAKESG
jgi:hypothetical protein